MPWSSSRVPPQSLSFVFESLCFFLSRTTKAPFTLCLSFYTPLLSSLQLVLMIRNLIRVQWMDSTYIHGD
jgi:hypothetical protein